MARRGIASGSRFEALAGYSRAVVDGEWVFVSGTTGFDYGRDTIAEDVVEQTRQIFRNIGAALAEAGAGLSDIVQLRTYLAEAAYWHAVAPVLGEQLADAVHTNAAIVCALIDPRIKVEIEAVARKRG